VYSSNLSLLSDYLQGKGIPIVSPVPVMSDTVLNDHPELFLSVSSIDVAQDAIAKKVGEYFTVMWCLFMPIQLELREML
jgi:hypothetical protein